MSDELLTGLRPIDARRLRKAALTEMIRIIQEEEPSKPSTRLSTDESLPSLAAVRQTEPRKLMTLLRGELDWVVMKCLEKQRDRRYETANALARDIQRYLADEAVEARPPSAGYRLKKFVQRNPLQLTLAGLVAVLLLGGVSVVWWQLNQAGVRREADLRRQLADEQRASADAARLARNAEAVASLLGQAEEALRAGDDARAEVVLEAARKRSTEGGADKDAERLIRLDADLALLRDLDAVAQFRWTVVDNQLSDPAVVAARTLEALKRFGVDPEAGDVDEAVVLVTKSVVRERIVSALDGLLSLPAATRSRAILGRVDSNRYRDAVRDAYLANDGETIEELAGRKAALEQPPGFTTFLTEIEAIPAERARELLQTAVSQWPGDLSVLMRMGESYSGKREEVDEQVRWYQAAVAAAPDNLAARTNLGGALKKKGDLDGAIASWNQVIARDAKFATAHTNLGLALAAKGDVEGAIACHRKAIELAPSEPRAYNNLGLALEAKGDLDGAIACYREAIEIDPKFAHPYSNLGLVLRAQGDLDEAIACHRLAVELDPKAASFHNNLGLALEAKGDVDGAITCYRQAIALDPKYAAPHTNLGAALFTKGLVDDAIACHRKAIELDPKDATPHTNLGVALAQKRDLDGAIACHRMAIALDPKNAEAHGNLGAVLCDYKQDYDAAVASFGQAIALAPKVAKTHFNLGNALYGKGDLDGAILSFRKAIKLDPTFAAVHVNLGVALDGTGDRDGAITCYRQAIALEPKNAVVHSGLGYALYGKGDLDGAIASYRQAIALDPKDFGAHFNLGSMLTEKGDLEGAIASFRQAIALDPKVAKPHIELGRMLFRQGDPDGAIASYRQAIALEPNDAWAQTGLAVLLAIKSQWGEAIAAYRKAIELDPALTSRLTPVLAGAYNSQGLALAGEGDVDGAIASYRQAIEVAPGNAEAHYNLGNSLLGKVDLEGAIASFRKAIELDPEQAEALCNLGQTLARQGRFAEALGPLKQGHELGSKRRDWRYPSAEWLRQAEVNAALEAKLPAILDGEQEPEDAAECVGLAEVCYAKKRYHTAVRFYVEAFTAAATLADDLKAGHRYNAACSASLAVAGKGEEAAKLEDAARTGLRSQALEWLKADLALWSRQLESDLPADRAMVREVMLHWQQDSDLASIRDRDELTKLAAEEQKAFSQLWFDVAALLTKSETLIEPKDE